MDIPSSQRYTFIVRIWTEPASAHDSSPHWRGWVQHVASGTDRYFQSPQELMHTIQEWIEGEHPHPPQHTLK